MDFRGVFDHGVVRPTEPVALPDGTEVECRSMPGAPNNGAASDQFWRTLSLEELARLQGVAGVKSGADLRGDWPQDERIDDLLAEVREWRR